MRDVFVMGVGMIRFGKFPEVWAEELGRQAILGAIKDAGIDP
ncbi:MAG: thiolase family protein, partial [Desulfobacteraceae bacterium]|nr:thiolase family protein [Desulfobacteraceae bacterium]